MKKLIVSILVLMTFMAVPAVQAESLFSLGATQHYQGVPRSLFGGVQARQIGDLISIVMNENITLSDNLTYSAEKSSTTVDTFTSFLNKWFGISLKGTDGFGGSNEVSNSAVGSRSMKLGDKIACQVVQQLPNGNLSVQGKKTIVNGNERLDFIITGVVDPRWLNVNGEIYSYNVSNLQFALSGRGNISRNQNEGIFNRFIKYLF
jgi:flagellar L-ring protein precursor FlgH